MNIPARYAVLLTAAVAAPSGQAAIVHTAEPFIGVTHHRVIERLDGTTAGDFTLPREVVADVLVIDPRARGVDFTLQPDNGEKPGEVTRSTTRDFVDSIEAQIGVNADFYDTKPPYEHTPTEFYSDVTHVNVSEGKPYSFNHQAGRPVFNLSPKNRAMVLTAGAPGTYDTAEGVQLFNAVGGNQRLVADGKNVTPDDNYAQALNPHTVIGVTRRGYVLIMTVDGRQDAFSRGMRTGEMADLLIEHFDAKDVLNLDGGGSSTLVMDDTDDGKQNARVINSPSDNASAQKPGNERLIANSLAVFARPNPDYTPLPAADRPAPPQGTPTLDAPTMFDDFETGYGRFADAPAASGSSRGVAPTSTRQLDDELAAEGRRSLRLDLRHTRKSDHGLQLRLLSGGADPKNNLHDGKAMGAVGDLELALRLEPGADPLFVSLLIDDGTLAGTKLERALFREVRADGGWHTYRWSLDDPLQWENFAGGNGVIDGPNAFLDSVYLSSAPDTKGGPAWQGTVWMDAVLYDPHGEAEVEVEAPEPEVAEPE